MIFSKLSIIAAVTAAALLTQSCQPIKVSPVVAALDGIALASTTAIGIVAALELTGRIDPVTGQIVVDYAKWANSRAQKTISLWQGPGTLEEKVSEALTIWNDPPGIPPNLSAGLSATLQTILAAINQFKHQLGGTQAALSARKLSATQEKSVGLDVTTGLKESKKKFAQLEKKIQEVEKIKK